VEKCLICDVAFDITDDKVWLGQPVQFSKKAR
jgi:hypothetical protein